MRDILIVCPQERDFRVIEAAALDARFRVRYVGPDLDRVDTFDAPAIVAECEALPAHGVAGTKDRSALLAAIVAERRGLPGPTTSAIVNCQHKPTSRSIQLGVAPDATPAFALLDGRLPEFGPPWIVKPVVGRLSQEVRRVSDASALATIHEQGGYRGGYARVAGLTGLPEESVHGFLVEQLVEGDEVTLEGYVHEGRVTVIGVTDSVKYPGTDSFWRFEYPSALSAERQDELAAIAGRIVPALGFEGGFFNVEFVVPSAGPAKVIEINGRIASQFAPLVQAVHGRSTYEALCALHGGEDPAWDANTERGVAISYVMRVFEDAYVESVPEPEDDLEVLVRPGLRLSEQGTNDAESFRLAIFTEWAETREQAAEQCEARADRLPFELR